jgi:DTW domain-containing protein YfiP
MTTYGLDILSNNSTKQHTVYSSIPEKDREMVGIARHLHKRLRVLEKNHTCRRCWLEEQYCICHSLQPIQLPSYIHRIFLLTHFKEIGMSIDTMKIILCAFPDACRLVVAGLPQQATMTEMLSALNSPSTLLLYPYENAKTFATILQEDPTFSSASSPFDIVLIDATWEQARRIFHRYLAQPCPAVRVQLSDTSLPDAGRQLRPHPLDHREIATAEGLRRLGQEMGAVLDGAGGGPPNGTTEDALLHYQRVASRAAGRQIGNFKRIVT